MPASMVQQITSQYTTQFKHEVVGALYQLDYIRTKKIVKTKPCVNQKMHNNFFHTNCKNKIPNNMHISIVFKYGFKFRENSANKMAGVAGNIIWTNRQD